ncbi:MAG: SCP2 sterol-binding domain-containing protein [Gammaproteobacteria bacterium]|nr:SCP2 sterol-binding domain-containing protein [Gammaproteobacteria bacterium]
MISDLAIALAEDAINRVLRLDRDALIRLGSLDGKTVCLKLALPEGEPLSLYVLPFEGGMRLRLGVAAAPDVTIQGNIPVFTSMLFGDAMTGLVGQADMQIRGDLELGHKFKQILDQLNVDWEEQTSRYLGDIAAHKLGRFVREFKAWRAQALHTVQQDFAEFVVEESRLVPPKEEVDRFMHGVDKLRADIDRLASRLQRLHADS